ncbi:uncharacterized protein BO80DRAFT_441731 [Aspergillus ibericus CBS 121593]|uniref:Uncharacterized protein n=1 Tax=Aspergillus ibericus CBS 121593 TaxID=1448316 RepID=A0A395H8U4_9EURO|nr:hypothetical protein BO80DRAFT_441731 [Aspergillus ibericus CBS 121593]RAL04262.1 hypothetical protein BO80DRAFT_441731 [Aspergillus ibericus CBS 121593]
MKFFDNPARVLATLLALVQVGLSYPTSIDLTAEDFMNMKTVTVRRDGTPVNQTDSSDIVCGGCTSTFRYTLTADGGNPHQNFVITQKGGSLSLSLGVNAGFSSAGFSVSESETYSTTNSFTCNGVAAEGGDICVLFYQAVTAFTVDVTEVTACECSGSTVIDRGTAVVYAPNANQKGSVAGRGINVDQHGVVQCSGDADRRVNYYCGPPGGPGYWDGKDAGPWNPDYVNRRAPAGCAIPIEANRYSD